MRFALMIALLAAVPLLAADEPKLPGSANQPSVALASATESDGKVTLKLRVTEVSAAIEKKTLTVYQTVTKLVDGKVVIEQVPLQQEVMVTVMKPARWREVKLTVGDKGVEVRDLAGKEVPAAKLAGLLEKETAVLLSSSGTVDPFYLQLAKEGTLVVIAPADRVMTGPGGLITPQLPLAPGAGPAPIGLTPPAPPPLPTPPTPPKEPLKEPLKDK
jgi:hypothetical protein